MVKWALLLGVVLLASPQVGCDGQVTVEDACRHVCTCTSLLPSRVDLCTSECVTDVAGVTIPQACLECVAAVSCEEARTSTDLCETECNFGG